MTASELARVRAGARPQGYTGYVEDVGGYFVAYGIPGSYSEDQQVSPKARVSSISAHLKVGGVDAGLSEWHRIVYTANSALKSHPICSRMATDSRVVGLIAEWRRDGSTFAAALFESPKPRSSEYTVGLGLTIDRRPGRFGTLSRIDCDGDLSGIWRSRGG